MESTVAGDLVAAIPRLRNAGVESPQLDAQLLMAHALGCSRLDIVSHPERVLTPSQTNDFRAVLGRRVARYPLAYILGSREFFGLEMEVSSAVLIPRPETEILIEECIKRVNDEARIADIGTGSGAIAVALAVNIPRATIWATDTSQDALKVARANAEKHGVAARVRTVRGDLLDALAPGATGQHVPSEQMGISAEQWDAIVSNPPYIATGVIESLELEVRQEPIGALDGGPDGLDVYRRLLVDGARLTRLLLVEIGVEQAKPVTQIAREAGWQDIEVIRDLAGIERVVVVRR